MGNLPALLRYAATPTCAALAVLTQWAGGGQDPTCSAMRNGMPLDGMAAMYLVMAIFHASPWLRWRRPKP